MKSIIALGVLGALSNCKLTTGSRYDSDDQYDLQIFGNLGNIGLGVSPDLVRTQTANTQPSRTISYEQTTQEALPSFGNVNSVLDNSNLNIQSTEPQIIQNNPEGFGKNEEFVIQDGYTGQGGISVQNGYNTQGGIKIEDAFGFPRYQNQRTGFEGYSISQGLGLNNKGYYQNLYQNSYSQYPRQTFSTRPQTNNLRYDSYFPSSIPYLPQIQPSQPKVKTLSGVSVNENGEQIKYTYTEEVVEGFRP